MIMFMLKMYNYQDQHGICVHILSFNYSNDDDNVNANDDVLDGDTLSYTYYVEKTTNKSSTESCDTTIL